MSSTAKAPSQFKQPSRKGKKAWRKNVDTTEIVTGLENLREEEIRGGVLAEKPADELFATDTTGSEQIKKQVAKVSKPLRADQIIAQRSAIPAVDSRKRASSARVTDGVLEPSSKKHKKDWVSRAEVERLKNVAAQTVHTDGVRDTTTYYDPWAESVPTEQDLAREQQFNFLEKAKKKVAPPTIRRAPIPLTASGKPVAAVTKPHAGTSYNPSFQEWDELLTREGAKEVEAEKLRLAEAEREAELQARIEAAGDDKGWKNSDDESAWEGFESEYETTDAVLKKKRPERKTQAQRNKIKRRKEAERQEKWKTAMAKKQQQAEKIKAIAEEVKQREEEKMQLAQLQGDHESEAEDDHEIRRKGLTGVPILQKRLEVVLPEELQDSLRLLKPEGNLLDDRFRNMLVRGKLEARKQVWQPKKKRVKMTEKWTYKDFKI